ncbi:MAG: BamA/TamA family outer membrane protein [Prevotellamassilia sp.]
MKYPSSLLPSGLCASLLLAASTLTARAEQVAPTLSDSTVLSDQASLKTVSNDSTLLTQELDGKKKKIWERGIVKKLVDYFRDSNKQKPEKKIDFGVLPGPHYSATTGLGLGILGTATYSTDRTDRSLPRSNASIYTDMTTGGFFLIGLKGNHIFPQERYRFDYKLNLSTFSAKFWGIGYDNADNDDNETDYRRNRIIATGRFMFKVAHNTYLGPMVNYRFFQAKDIDPKFLHLWQGQKKKLHAVSAGLSFTYDSRDFMLNAKRGTFFQIDQTFNPRFLGNGNYGFSSTEVTFAKYGRLWKGAVLAGELHALFNYGNTPWPLLAEVGSNDRMRGYYEGRYRDQNLIEGQLELRQHIKGRNGIALWVGLANAFPRFDRMAWRKTLPNCGIGYRWEFKKGINVRIDYGLTRDGGGFIFNINEAF